MKHYGQYLRGKLISIQLLTEDDAKLFNAAYFKYGHPIEYKLIC